VKIRVVLVRPREPGNVGAAARALANFGLDELVLVQPQPRRRYRPGGFSLDPARGDADPPIGPEPITQHAMARALAAKAAAALSAARIVPDLRTALADCVLAAAFTARRRVRAQPEIRDPRPAAELLVAAASRGRVALVFGPEDRGLTNREIDACGLIVRIPACEAYPVLNLAAAVAVAAHEIIQAAGPGRAVEPALRRGRAPAEPGAPRSPARSRAARQARERELATVAELERLYASFRDLLVRVRFLARREEQGMVTLRGILGRAALERREVGFLMGVIRRLDQRVRDADPVEPAGPAEQPGQPDPCVVPGGMVSHPAWRNDEAPRPERPDPARARGAPSARVPGRARPRSRRSRRSDT
jgi:TrmH family RNA methyltransferase